ncbi:hypothetical protein GCM10023093_24360 [Nemorincola caseinilytica]|uniref:YD repeat-containing protein n=1 Tax=Nemorincola caseinilytica TaxID=2054315 RepID=A0ABP8NLI1_9BACT
MHVTRWGENVDEVGDTKVWGPYFAESRTYNMDGNITMAKYGDDRNKGAVYSVHTYKYNGGLLAKSEVKDKRHGFDYKTLYKYSNDRLTEELWYTKDARNDSKIQYIYDGDRLLRAEQFVGGKKYPSRVDLYDERQNIVERMFVTEFEGGMIFTYFRSVYDRKNRLIEETSHRTNGENKRTVYRYDDSKPGMKMLQYENGHLQRTTEYLYDRYGNVVKEHTRYDDGNSRHTTTKYVYDLQGNILKKTELYKGGTTTTTYLDFDRYGNYRRAVWDMKGASGSSKITMDQEITYFR